MVMVRRLGNGGMGAGGQCVTRGNRGGPQVGLGTGQVKRRLRRPREGSGWAGKDGRLFMMG